MFLNLLLLVTGYIYSMRFLRPLNIAARSGWHMASADNRIRACLFCALMAPLGAAAAGPASSLTVTATIMKHASITTLTAPSSVVLTAADVTRGYVDVPVQAEVAIQNNSPAGYLLVVDQRSDFVRQIRITGLGAVVEVGPAGGVIAQNATGRGMSKTLLKLGFRFALSGSARQGVYVWPIQLGIAPL